MFTERVAAEPRERQQVVDQLSHLHRIFTGHRQIVSCFRGKPGGYSSSRIREKPSTARNGARRSWDTEYAKASSSRLASSSSSVRRPRAAPALHSARGFLLRPVCGPGYRCRWPPIPERHRLTPAPGRHAPPSNDIGHRGGASDIPCDRNCGNLPPSTIPPRFARDRPDAEHQSSPCLSLLP